MLNRFRVLLIVSVMVCLTRPLASQESGAIFYGAGSTTVNLDGREVRLGWDAGTIEATRPRNSPFALSAGLDIDLSQLQSALVARLNRRQKHDECGDRIRVSGAKVHPDGSGRAVVSGRVHYERWECASFDVPTGLRCSGFPPECRMQTRRETAKTKLVSQSGDVAIAITPLAQDSSISADVQVIHTSLDGWLGEATQALGLEAEIRQEAQRLIESELRSRPIAVTLPGEIGTHAITIRSAEFVDRGDGRLGARIEADASVSVGEFLQIHRDLP